MKNTAAPRHPSLAILVVLLLCVATVFRYFWWVSGWFIPPSALASAPTTSDIIAAASALFSAFAFVGLIYTIMLQRHELLTQRLDQEEPGSTSCDKHSTAPFSNCSGCTRQMSDPSMYNCGMTTRPSREGAPSWKRRPKWNSRSPSISKMSLTPRMTIPRGESHITHRFVKRRRVTSHTTLETSTTSLNTWTRVPSSTSLSVRREVRAQLSQHEFLLLLANGLRRSGRSKIQAIHRTIRPASRDPRITNCEAATFLLRQERVWWSGHSRVARCDDGLAREHHRVQTSTRCAHSKCTRLTTC